MPRKSLIDCKKNRWKLFFARERMTTISWTGRELSKNLITSIESCEKRCLPQAKSRKNLIDQKGSHGIK
jgi:hypothetical protein